MTSIFDMARKGIGALAGKTMGLSAAVGKGWEGSWGRAIGSDLLGYASRGIGRMGRMGNLGLSMTAGGLYGAVSDDTSVLGGMAMGAGLYGASRLGMRGGGIYSRLRGRGVSRAAAAGGALSGMGRMSSRYIGTSYTKAANGFRGLKGRFFG